MQEPVRSCCKRCIRNEIHGRLIFMNKRDALKLKVLFKNGNQWWPLNHRAQAGRYVTSREVWLMWNKDIVLKFCNVCKVVGMHLQNVSKENGCACLFWGITTSIQINLKIPNRVEKFSIQISKGKYNISRYKKYSHSNAVCSVLELHKQEKQGAVRCISCSISYAGVFK